METNLEKAKRLTKDNAAIKGIDLPDDNYFYKMLELAAMPDVVNKNDLLPDVMRRILLEISKDEDTACSIYNDQKYKGYREAVRDFKIIIKQITGYEGD